LSHKPLILFGSPNGTRTRVFGVRGRYPRPLDDGTAISSSTLSIIGYSYKEQEDIELDFLPITDNE
jgi:hypothetical protein